MKANLQFMSSRTRIEFNPGALVKLIRLIHADERFTALHPCAGSCSGAWMHNGVKWELFLATRRNMVSDRTLYKATSAWELPSYSAASIQAEVFVIHPSHAEKNLLTHFDWSSSSKQKLDKLPVSIIFHACWSVAVSLLHGVKWFKMLVLSWTRLLLHHLSSHVK